MGFNFNFFKKHEDIPQILAVQDGYSGYLDLSHVQKINLNGFSTVKGIKKGDVIVYVTPSLNGRVFIGNRNKTDSIYVVTTDNRFMEIEKCEPEKISLYLHSEFKIS